MAEFGRGAGGVICLSFLFLSACASTGGMHGGSLGGPGIADSAHYKSGNMKPYNVRGKTYRPDVPDAGYSETGMASWYGNESGTRTADGEVYNADGISAAHRTFPLPSVAEVTNLDNGKTVRVRVNDRGPFNDRIIDLSRGAAKALGVYQTGTARVRVTWLGPADAAGEAPVVIRQSSADEGHYIVQLGAFSVRDNAETAQARMIGAKLDQHGGLYVVYLGPYDGAAKAESHRQEAIDAGFRDAILKRDD